MHPSHYPWVRSGPVCACTHARVTHVGTNQYGSPQADLGCSECELCERYTPLEAIDHEAELHQYAEMVRSTVQRRERQQRFALGLVLFALVTVPVVVVFARGLAIPWLFVLVTVGLANMDLMVLDRWRAGDDTASDVALQVGFSTAAMVFFLSLWVGLPAAENVAMGLMAAFGTLFVVRSLAQIRRAMRSVEAMTNDLRDRP